MIITRLHSENFLKYAELEFNDLPASGLIAVSGPNESGKSTIGETICFALFGRTYSVNADTPEKLIRWGQPRCNVSIDFRARTTIATESRVTWIRKARREHAWNRSMMARQRSPKVPNT